MARHPDPNDLHEMARIGVNLCRATLLQNGDRFATLAGDIVANGESKVPVTPPEFKGDAVVWLDSRISFQLLSAVVLAANRTILVQRRRTGRASDLTMLPPEIC